MSDQFREQVTRRGPSAEPRHPETRGELAGRITQQFEECVGLSLTRAQAYRLFDVDPQRCERVLQELISQGVLVVTDDGSLKRGG